MTALQRSWARRLTRHSNNFTRPSLSLPFLPLPYSCLPCPMPQLSPTRPSPKQLSRRCTNGSVSSLPIKHAASSPTSFKNGPKVLVPHPLPDRRFRRNNDSYFVFLLQLLPDAHSFSSGFLHVDGILADKNIVRPPWSVPSATFGCSFPSASHGAKAGVIPYREARFELECGPSCDCQGSEG